jgi:hypothetical protein
LHRRPMTQAEHSSTTTPSELRMETEVRRVVRGEAHWSTLRTTDLRIEHEGSTWTFSPVQEAVEVEAKDVAVGLLNLMHRHDDLVEWASFLLAADLVSLDGLGESVHGESLLTSLWDLSFERDLRPEVVEVAKAVLAED